MSCNNIFLRSLLFHLGSGHNTSNLSCYKVCRLWCCLKVLAINVISLPLQVSFCDFWNVIVMHITCIFGRRSDSSQAQSASASVEDMQAETIRKDSLPSSWNLEQSTVKVTDPLFLPGREFCRVEAWCPKQSQECQQRVKRGLLCLALFASTISIILSSSRFITRPWRVPEGTRLLNFQVTTRTLPENFYYSSE